MKRDEFVKASRRSRFDSRDDQPQYLKATRTGEMRILVSCQQSLKRHPIPAYDFWRPYFVHGLREAGHEVLEVPGIDWAEGVACPPGAVLEAWRGRTWEGVRSFVRQEQQRAPVHMFLSYLYPQQVEILAIKELQRMGVPCVNFFCDNVREFRHIPAEYRPFALHWVPEFEALAMYRAGNVAHIHAPMPCWIPVELRSMPAAETEPPTFIGSADVLRRELLSRALHEGADFIIRGPGWERASDQTKGQPQQPRSISKVIVNQLASVRTHGPGILLRKAERALRPVRPLPVPAANIREAVDGAEYFRLTREALVTIGVNRVPTARASDHRPIAYSRLRDIEAPMLGACYLTEWTQGLEKLYDLDAEIETYRTTEELGAKLAELKKYSKRRRDMRTRAQLRALQDHNIGRSIEWIGRHLGLSSRL